MSAPLLHDADVYHLGGANYLVVFEGDIAVLVSLIHARVYARRPFVDRLYLTPEGLVLALRSPTPIRALECAARRRVAPYLHGSRFARRKWHEANGDVAGPEAAERAAA